MALLAALAAGTMAAPEGSVATVGSLSVSRQELDERSADLERSYEARTGSALNADTRKSVRRQALEVLIRGRLYRLEAARRKVPVSDAEAESVLKRAPVFNPNGRFSAQAFENARRNEPAAFQQALAEAKREIGARRLAAQLVAKATPPEETLRRAARRELETVPLEVLAIPRAQVTGRYPEPRETDVVAEYRRRASEFVIPAQAEVLVVAFETDVEGGDRAPLRARADSAVAALRGGQAIEQVAERFDGSLRRYSLRDDNLPGSWRASAATNARVFAAAPGTVLADPVPSSGGWYAVWVDTTAPRHAAPLAEVSEQIRDGLRQAIQKRADEGALRKLYAEARDSLARPGYRLRGALIETARIKLSEPSAAELDAFYRAHLAEYTRYDAATASIVVTPLAEVRGKLVQQWKDSRRDLVAHDLANRLADTWSQARRDRSLESQATVKDLGEIPFGAPVELGAASAAVTDSLRGRVYDLRVEVVPYAGGYAVAHVYKLEERIVPTFEQVRAPLEERLTSEADQAEVAKASRIYEEHPDSYLTGQMVYYTRLWTPQPELIDVPLTRNEVVSFYERHKERYASPERFHLRHILFRPKGEGAEAGAKALERATEILNRARSGGDFAELARTHSEDDNTRDDGGDLFLRTAEQLEPELRGAASKLPLGAVGGPVKTAAGYHVIKLEEHIEAAAEPLAWIYTTVGSDAALEKAQRISRHMADSLYQVIRTPAQGRAAAERLQLRIEQYRHLVGNREYPEERLPMMERLERLDAGEMYPGTEFFLGQGSAVMWVDSVAAPRLSSWEQAVGPIRAEMRRREGRGALLAKLAELDSLMASGWSLDSLGGLWGGLYRDEGYSRREGLGHFGGAAQVDSVVFGEPGGRPLDPGSVSGWIELREAAVRLRVGPRRQPTAADIEHQAAQNRGLVIEYRLQDDLKGMRQRFPVTILDPVLRDVTLPPMPPMPEL